MKKIAVFALISMAVFSCSKKEEKPQSAKPVTIKTAKTPVVGADQDLHGCKTSAGYTWSELNKACIRVFEKAERYDAAGGNQVKMPAFILFKDDKAEVFIQTEKGPFIMEKKAGLPIYAKDGWELEILNVSKKGKLKKMCSWLGKDGLILYYRKN